MNGVRSIHAVRTRGTEAEVYCDLHVLVDPQMTVLAAHDLGDEVEGVVAAAFPQIKEVLVHIEPDTAAERAPRLAQKAAVRFRGRRLFVICGDSRGVFP